MPHSPDAQNIHIHTEAGWRLWLQGGRREGGGVGDDSREQQSIIVRLEEHSRLDSMFLYCSVFLFLKAASLGQVNFSQYSPAIHPALSGSPSNSTT